ISLFLATEAGAAEVKAIEERLGSEAQVASYRFVSREEALRQLEQSGLGDVLGGLGSNPLPDAFVVSARGDDPGVFERLQARFREWEQVEHVQLDSAWVERLHALLGLGRSAVLLLAA